MNQTLPRKKLPCHQELDMIIHSLGSKKTQAARQLRSWKESKFMFDEHILTLSTEKIASNISDRLSNSAKEIVELSLDSILPSKSKKLNDDSSGSSRLTLAQSSDVMETYLRELSIYLFGITSNGSGTKSELVKSVFILLKNVLSSYVTIISENVPKTLGMLDRSDFLFVVEREEMIRNVFSDWESVVSLSLAFRLTKLIQGHFCWE